MISIFQFLARTFSNTKKNRTTIFQVRQDVGFVNFYRYFHGNQVSYGGLARDVMAAILVKVSRKNLIDFSCTWRRIIVF